jgi:UDP-N-acetyl-D-mannosaminuronic acid dehydrogenase
MGDLEIYSDKHICVIGLGYVGLTFAVAVADIGFKVFGVEIRDDVLDNLKKSKPHFYEPGLQERLHRVIQSGHLQCVKNIPRSASCTVFVITVGTPLDCDGYSRLDMVESVGREVADNMQTGSLIIMRSTVKLGTTRNIIAPILEASGKHFDLAFCPERTLEGKALVELRQLPQIVGGMSPKAALRASQFFQFITPTVIRVSSIETAEMIKLIDNAQRDVTFAYANEVARACDAIGVSAAEVIQAGKLGYPRTNLSMPGPVGGPCLEKDSHILAEGLREIGIEPSITMAARRVNENQPYEVVNFIKKVCLQFENFSTKPVITLMGIAFKGQPATDDLRGTMALPIFTCLRNIFPDAVYRGYDAVVSQAEIRRFGLQPLATLNQAFNDSNLVLILNNHQIFNAMPIESLATNMERPGMIYDFWNCFKTSDLHLPHGIIYVALGSHGLINLPNMNT